MFSGIVSERGRVEELSSDGRRLSIRAEMFNAPAEALPAIGASISVSGVCLTITALKSGCADFDLASETLRRTTLGKLRAGSEVNLERSLRVGDTIDGHFVQGHVDAVGVIQARTEEENTVRLELSLPEVLKPLVVPKGAICIDGVSLTVGEVGESSFSVYVIPHTLTVTTAGGYRPGTEVNLEADCVARYLQGLAKPYLA